MIQLIRKIKTTTNKIRENQVTKVAEIDQCKLKKEEEIDAFKLLKEKEIVECKNLKEKEIRDNEILMTNKVNEEVKQLYRDAQLDKIEKPMPAPFVLQQQSSIGGFKRKTRLRKTKCKERRKKSRRNLTRQKRN